MNPLLLALPSKWIIIGSILLLSHGFTAYKVWDHMKDQQKLETAAMTTKIVTVEKSVLVADMNATNKAKEAAVEAVKLKAEIEKGWKEWDEKQKPATTECPAFELDADGLRIWNWENTGPFNRPATNQ